MRKLLCNLGLKFNIYGPHRCCAINKASGITDSCVNLPSVPCKLINYYCCNSCQYLGQSWSRKTTLITHIISHIKRPDKVSEQLAYQNTVKKMRMHRRPQVKSTTTQDPRT